MHLNLSLLLVTIIGVLFFFFFPVLMLLKSYVKFEKRKEFNTDFGGLFFSDMLSRSCQTLVV